MLFDSSVYITALRAGSESAIVLHRWVKESPLWLSSVVPEELYAGASSTDRRKLEKLERDFEKANRVLIPNLNDWTFAWKDPRYRRSETWIREDRKGASHLRRVNRHKRSSQWYQRYHKYSVQTIRCLSTAQTGKQK